MILSESKMSCKGGRNRCERSGASNKLEVYLIETSFLYFLNQSLSKLSGRHGASIVLVDTFMYDTGTG